MRRCLFIVCLLLMIAHHVTAQTARYEYWLDNDYANRTVVANTQEDITLDMDLSGVPSGLHYFTFRSQEQSGEWGAISRYTFVLPQADTTLDYEYWLDNDYANRTKVTGNAPTDLTIEIGGLSPGLHYFSMRTQSQTGEWGGISRYILYVSQGEALPIISCWVDDNRKDIQYVEVDGSEPEFTVDLFNHPEGSHNLYLEGVNSANEVSWLSGYDFSYSPLDAIFDGRTAWVGLDATLDDAFARVGGRTVAAETITSVVWKNSNPLTDNEIQGITNPNLLVYVNDASLAPSNVQNVVINGMAREIVLTDVTDGNNDWYAPQAFVAERISYTRNFTQSTTKGTSRGWESIALPFDVQTIQHESKGVIAPFNNSASNKHFWLRRLTDNGLQAATNIEANTPYIISMPNSEEYTSDYNLNGRVTFSAQNIDVPATTTKVLALADSSIVMVPAMQRQSRSSSVWALNVGEVRGQYFEGSVFERDYRTVRPFEAYTVHRQENGQPAPRYVPIQEIAGVTGIETIDREPLTLNQWYDMQGRKLQGQPKQKGVYISKGKKVVVK